MGKFLSQLKPPRGAVRNKKRLGRGDASGHGGTSTKGHKGQKARSGGFHKVGFEGGQMPIARRLPKRGFTSVFKKQYAVLNVGDLKDLPSGTKVDGAYLKEQGKVKKLGSGLKILGEGEIKVPLTILAAKVSKSAQEKIEKAGGKIELLSKQPKTEKESKAKA